MFWRKKKEITVTEEAINAMDRIAGDVEDLHGEKQCAQACIQTCAEWLSNINDQLAVKSALCGTLVAQLQAVQENITQQTGENEAVRVKLLESLGE